MSEQKTIPKPNEKQTQMNQRMGQLSQIYKNPIRQMISQTEEIILNACNELMQNVSTLELRSQDLTAEIMRLRTLCDANKITHTIQPPKENKIAPPPVPVNKPKKK